MDFVTANSSAEIIQFRTPRAHRTAEDEAARKRRRKCIKHVSVASIRAAELNRWISYEYGEIIPGIIDEAVVVLNVLAMTANPRSRMTNWLEWRAPWFDDEDAIDAILVRPRWLKADAIGKMIGLTAAIRKQLRIKTIGAIDMTARERKQMRIKNKIGRQKQRRREAGMMPRDEYERNSLEKQKPWVTLGISRRTWFRRQKERFATADTDVMANNSSIQRWPPDQCQIDGARLKRAARSNRQ